MTVHPSLVKLLDAAAFAIRPPRFLAVLHLGCGVPQWWRDSTALAGRRLLVRAYEEDEKQVAAAAAAVPGACFQWRELDSFPCLRADVIILGPGWRRMRPGGAECLLARIRQAQCTMLLVALPPGASPILATPPDAIVPDPDGGIPYSLWRPSAAG